MGWCAESDVSQDPTLRRARGRRAALGPHGVRRSFACARALNALKTTYNTFNTREKNGLKHPEQPYRIPKTS